MHKTYELIEISDDDENMNNQEEETKDNKNIIIDDNIEITIIKEYKKNDSILDDFVEYCIKNELFNNDYYDHSDIFSIIETKLPTTFDNMAKNNSTVSKVAFCNYFTNFKNSKYIFDLMDKDNKKYICWDDFKNLLLPYIKNVVI